jgi:hypothetical protein
MTKTQVENDSDNSTTESIWSWQVSEIVGKY